MTVSHFQVDLNPVVCICIACYFAHRVGVTLFKIEPNFIALEHDNSKSSNAHHMNAERQLKS